MGDILGQQEHLGKRDKGQQLIHGMYFCTVDVAFYLSACQLPSAPWFWQKGEENGERAERRMLPGEWWLQMASPCGWTS